MIDFKRTLADAESRQERLAATLRLVVFLALLATVLSLRQHGSHHHPVLSVTLTYGALAAIGLVFAWRGIFHPSLPFIFITLEVGLIAVQTALMGSLMGQPSASLAALPIAAVIFVILAHASMRYRPWLVIYAAGLFLLFLFLAPTFLPAEQPGSSGGAGMQDDWVHHRVFPPIMIVLTAGILFVTARGTRQLLHVSVEEQLARHRLSRFFAPGIAKQLIASSNEDAMTGAVQPITVLFADIRGFSALAEALTPHQLSVLLGEFREILADTIQKHDGVVDKFIGDAVLAVFGFPDTGRMAANRSLECANEIFGKLEEWTEERQARGLAAVSIGIGMHFGEAFVGVVGNESLLEFTVIGDTVNIAERLERLTRQFDAEIVVSGAFAEATGLDLPASGWRLEQKSPLAGHSRPIDILYRPRKQPIYPV